MLGWPRVVRAVSHPMMTGRLGAAENPLREARFYVEPVVAWRAWRVTEEEHHGLRLRSVSWGVRWPVRKPMRAHCLPQLRGFKLRKGLEHEHAPYPEHGCGLYAVKARRQAEEWVSDWLGRTSVIGRVKLWGKMFEFSDGYLAEYGYPLAIVATDPVCEQIALRYQIDLI